MKTSGHFAVICRVQDQWALFDNEKVTLPEYEQGQNISELNSAILKGSYLLLYKKTDQSYQHQMFCLCSKQIPEDYEINDSENDTSFSENDENYAAVRHSDVFDHTFIISSMFSNLFGILNVDPVGAPSKPIGIPVATDSFFDKFIRCVSQQLANKVFFKK